MHSLPSPKPAMVVRSTVVQRAGVHPSTPGVVQRPGIAPQSAEKTKIRQAENTGSNLPAPSSPSGFPPNLMTTEECAEMLRCSPRTLEVDRCRRRWRVPYLHCGRKVVYDRSAVLQWLAAQNTAKVVMDTP